MTAAEALDAIAARYGCAELVATVRAERDAIAADAARYRWIRQNPTWIGWDADYQAEFIDNAVDAALAGKDAP